MKRNMAEVNGKLSNCNGKKPQNQKVQSHRIADDDVDTVLVWHWQE